jgi:hypothetical protein
MQIDTIGADQRCQTTGALSLPLTLIGGISYTDLIAFMRLTFTEDTCIRY